jgi:hypothetical protein
VIWDHGGYADVNALTKEILWSERRQKTLAPLLMPQQSCIPVGRDGALPDPEVLPVAPLVPDVPAEPEVLLPPDMPVEPEVLLPPDVPVEPEVLLPVAPVVPDPLLPLDPVVLDPLVPEPVVPDTFEVLRT